VLSAIDGECVRTQTNLSLLQPDINRFQGTERILAGALHECSSRSIAAYAAAFNENNGCTHRRSALLSVAAIARAGPDPVNRQNGRTVTVEAIAFVQGAYRPVHHRRCQPHVFSRLPCFLNIRIEAPPKFATMSVSITITISSINSVNCIRSVLAPIEKKDSPIKRLINRAIPGGRGLLGGLWCNVLIHDYMIEMKSRNEALTLETESDLFKWKQYEVYR
jgi:hypothetical protein